MQLIIPFQAVLIGLGAAVIITGAVISDPLLIMLGAFMTVVAISGLGIALRMRRRQQGLEPAPEPRGRRR